MSDYLTVLKKYAVFTGRAPRAEFWYFVLFNFIVSMVLQMLFGSVAETAEDGAASPLAFLPVLYTLVILLPSLAVAARYRSQWVVDLDCLNPAGRYDCADRVLRPRR